MENKLTKKEALEQGFTLCGDADSECQSLMEISDIADEDITYRTYIAAKEPIFPEISEDELKEIVTDHIVDKWMGKVGDEMGLSIYLEEFDFKPFSDALNKKIGETDCAWYPLTEIQLIP
jgi:hypothetical protein